MNNPTPGNKPKKLEPMADFFTARLDNYEAHMLRNGDSNYRKLSELVPENTKRLLDLGCGTGLELDWIFKRLPYISVTGIDLTPAMLYKLQQKHPDKKLDLLCRNYFEIDLGKNIYDAAISCATLHHFLRDNKIKLYKNIHGALKAHGLYFEDDYMVDEKSLDNMQSESTRLRHEQNIPDGEFYHFDIPYTIEDQIEMLKEAGFTRIDITNRSDTGAILIAHK